MNESSTNPWQGDWQLRLRDALAALGFPTLRDFLSAHPGVSYIKLASMLAETHVAALQLYGEHLRAATTAAELRETAIDCLVRFLNEHVRRGWRRGIHFQFRAASALADWHCAVITFASADQATRDSLEAVSQALMASDAPEGWLPRDASDPFITEAFDSGWPKPRFTPNTI